MYPGSRLVSPRAVDQQGMLRSGWGGSGRRRGGEGGRRRGERGQRSRPVGGPPNQSPRQRPCAGQSGRAKSQEEGAPAEPARTNLLEGSAGAPRARRKERLLSLRGGLSSLTAA